MKVRVLGALEVVGPGDTTLEVAGARLRRLLVRLAVDAGKVVSSGELVEAVWGGDPPADPVGALQTLVSRARRVLGDGSLLQQSHTGYRLAIADADLDLAQFRSLCREGRDRLAAGDALQARSGLAAALALWRGPALADADEARDDGYAAPLVARLEEERLDALTSRIDADLALGQAAEVVPELEDLTHAYPLRERLVEQLMRALAATGRAAEALTAYDRLRTTLADTLGTDPSAGLRELHMTLLRESDASRSGVGRRPTLRPGLTSFLGRESEQARVLSVLGSSRVATIVGPGGAGKTRLATEVGRAWQEANGGGAAMVELAPVRDESVVLQAFLGALDLREAHVLDRAMEPRRPRDELSQLVAAVSGSPFLLVVDNCEHLLDVTARLVEELLRLCPDLRVLATSREPLGVDGESLRVLPPLGLPPWDVSLEQASRYAAVQLFLDRAVAVRPDLALDSATLPAVVEIVRRLDGMPLAIELAAARTRVLPVTEVAARLSDRFRLLTGGRRTALPRHQTLRAVVEWSWDLLIPHERLLAERLAVFPAGATPETASAVCADDSLPAAEVPTLLGSLVDKSLLTLDESAGLRYRMLETIREYGIDRLAERGEVEQARQRHAYWFAHLVSLQAPLLYTREQVEAARVLELERDNILAAVRFLGDAGDAARTLRIVLELSWYWSLLGAHGEARNWLEFAQTVPGDAPDGARELAHAMSLLMTGMDDNTAFQSSMTARAGEASDLLEGTTDPDYAWPMALVLRAMLAFFGERWERAAHMMAEAEKQEDAWVRAAMLMMQAVLAENDGDVDTLRSSVEAAYEAFAPIGDRWGLATVLAARAQVQTLDGDLAGALDSFGRASAYVNEIGAHSDEAMMRMRMAGLLLRVGDIESARREIELVDTSDETGFGPVFASAMNGMIAVRGGDLAEIHQRRSEVQDLLVSASGPASGQDHGRTMMLSVLAVLHLAVGDLTAATLAVQDGYVAAVRTHDMPILATQTATTAAVVHALGRAAEAAELLGATARIRGADDPTDIVVARLRVELTAELGPEGFIQAYERGWTLSKQDAVSRFDPTSLDLRVGAEPADEHTGAAELESQARRR